MKKGLIIGKFLPFHNGHKALIEFAMKNCDTLTIVICEKDRDKFSGFDRMSMIMTEFDKVNFKYEILNVTDWPNDNNKYNQYVVEFYTDMFKLKNIKPDVIFSSEKYGEHLAKSIGCKHKLFDEERKNVPVKGRFAMVNPFGHWNFLPEPTKRFFTKLICIYGAESVGKSTLTKQLASRFNMPFVHEGARDILKTNGDIDITTIKMIADRQKKMVLDTWIKTPVPKAIFCDTDAITTEIYSRHYLKEVPKEVYDAQNQLKYSYYLFLDPEGTPWVKDPLRDLGDLREEMDYKFLQALITRGLSFTRISGNWEERFNTAEETVKKLIGEK